MLTFEELGKNDCRFPIADCDDPAEWGFLFCGEAVARKGCPYCVAHMRPSYMHGKYKPRNRRVIHMAPLGTEAFGPPPTC